MFTNIILNAEMLIKIQGSDLAFCKDKDSSEIQFRLASKTSEMFRGPRSRRPSQTLLFPKYPQLVQTFALGLPLRYHEDTATGSDSSSKIRLLLSWHR